MTEMLITQNPPIKKKLNGHVGFSNLPNQVHRKSLKKGFQFTLMAVGESGLGKSTLLNSLFNTMLYPNKEPVDITNETNETPRTVEIQSQTADIEENGVKLKLTLVDTPGFGDFVNNEDSWKPILDNIHGRFQAFLEQENRVNRSRIVDTRVHACLYFISPTGHSLKPLDIQFMKALSHSVNLVPVIAKSDTMTDEELVVFKKRILNDIAVNQIQIFMPPNYDNDDAETIKENQLMIGCMPFAVVGSDKEIEIDGKLKRGRQYPWGVIDIENESHCDFIKLGQMLIRTHMEELRDHTNFNLYESYRTRILSDQGGELEYKNNPLNKLEEEKQLHEQKMMKMEAEMKLVFQQKVAEKEAKLKASENELYARHHEMKQQLEQQRFDLEEKKKKLLGGSTPEKSKKLKGLFK